MRKEFRIKKAFALIVVMSLFATTLISAATGIGRKDITAVLAPDIKVQLNNKLLQMTDANNDAVEPILYNGTTYLPIRALSENLDLPVGWDAATSTVLLGSTDQKVMIDSDHMFQSRRFVFTRDKSKLQINDIQYNSAIISKDSDWWADGYLGNMDNGRRNGTIIEVEAAQKFGGSIYMSADATIEGGAASFALIDYDTEEVYYSGRVELGEVQTFEVDVYGATKLVISCNNEVVHNFEIKEYTETTQFVGILDPYYIK